MYIVYYDHLYTYTYIRIMNVSCHIDFFSHTIVYPLESNSLIYLQCEVYDLGFSTQIKKLNSVCIEVPI